MAVELSTFGAAALLHGIPRRYRWEHRRVARPSAQRPPGLNGKTPSRSPRLYRDCTGFRGEVVREARGRGSSPAGRRSLLESAKKWRRRPLVAEGTARGRDCRKRDRRPRPRPGALRATPSRHPLTLHMSNFAFVVGAVAVLAALLGECAVLSRSEGGLNKDGEQAPGQLAQVPDDANYTYVSPAYCTSDETLKVCPVSSPRLPVHNFPIIQKRVVLFQQPPGRDWLALLTWRLRTGILVRSGDELQRAMHRIKGVPGLLVQGLPPFNNRKMHLALWL